MANPPPSTPLRGRLGALLHKPLVLGAELLLAVLVVLTLNNAVIYLFLLGWLSLWLRRSGWKPIGLTRPAHWGKTLLAGIGLSLVYQLFSIGLLVPLLHRLTHTTLDLSQFDAVRGSVGNLLVWLVIVWVLAAFGEEMVYRGYLLNRLADLWGQTQFGWGASVLISSLLFGSVHLYQGLAGVVETFVFGMVLAALYTLTKRNLWLPIIFHGMVDTIGFLLIFLGLIPSGQ